MRDLAVLKYGGLLLRDPEGRGLVADDVEDARCSGRAVVVVVSAMGRAGDPYATDTLLRLLASAGGRPDPRTRDLLLSCGEVVSAALVAHLLTGRGWPARPFTGPAAGISTSDRFGAASILEVDPTALRRELNRGVVPVVAGFQGLAPGGHVATLGRGGSDLTAVALGAALGAAVEIVKEVPGIMTADPASVPAARLLRRVDHVTAHRLALHGSQVLHPRASALAERQGVPLLVRRIASGGGTEIVSTGASRLVDVPDGAVLALTSRRRLSVLRVEADRRRHAAAILAELRGRAELDSLWLGEGSLVVVAQERDGADLAGRFGRRGLPVAVRTGCARVTALGAHMASASGQLLRGLLALEASEIDVYEVNGSAEAISYLVPDAEVDPALRALHAAFGLDAAPPERPGAREAAGAVPGDADRPA